MGVQSNSGVSHPVPHSGLAKFIDYLTKLVNPLIGVFGVAIACVMLAGMMFLTFFDVGGRFILNKPINGSLEITEYLMVFLVSFGLGYCALKNGHIRVDLIMQYTSRKANLWFDVFAYGVSCIFYIFICWQAWLYALSKVASKMTSSVLLIPVYPFVFALSVGAAFLVLVLLRDFLKSVEEVSK
jgi:TRAP-type C4-dicarboxylate transport system permease small subunit